MLYFQKRTQKNLVEADGYAIAPVGLQMEESDQKR